MYAGLPIELWEKILIEATNNPPSVKNILLICKTMTQIVIRYFKNILSYDFPNQLVFNNMCYNNDIIVYYIYYYNRDFDAISALICSATGGNMYGVHYFAQIILKQYQREIPWRVIMEQSMESDLNILKCLRNYALQCEYTFNVNDILILWAVSVKNPNPEISDYFKAQIPVNHEIPLIIWYERARCAAEMGNIGEIKRCKIHAPDIQLCDLSYHGAFGGHMDVVKYCLGDDFNIKLPKMTITTPLSNMIFEVEFTGFNINPLLFGAAINSNYDLLVQLIDLVAITPVDWYIILSGALYDGNSDLIMLCEPHLDLNYQSLLTYVIKIAVCGGHPKSVEYCANWILSLGGKVHHGEIAKLAANWGHLDIIKKYNIDDCWEDILEIAIDLGYVYIINYIRNIYICTGKP